MLRASFLIAGLFLAMKISCQEPKIPELIKDIAEELSASETDQEASAAYLDRLYELAEKPVNINAGTEEELSRLFFLSDFQVKALADYIRTTGKLVSFNELANIPGFDRSTAEMIIPFSTLTSSETEITDTARLKSLLVANFSIKPGSYDTSSIGSAWKILTKYKLSAGNFSGGFTTEKDAGEKYFTPGTINPDFFSAYVSYAGRGIVRRVILGDYSAKFGQGTNINSGTGTALSITSQGYMSSTNEVKPYTSADENNFFRGIAAAFSYKNIDLSLLISKNKTDATPGTSSGSSDDCIENLYKSGIHNTPSLLMKKDLVSESLLGLNLSFNFNKIRVGTAWSQNSFSLPIEPGAADPEKIFSFRGKTNNIFSVYYNGMIKNILLYGEISANEPAKYDMVQGMSFRPSDRLQVNFLYHRDNPGYTSFHGKGPAGMSASYPGQSILGNFTFEAARHLFVSSGVCIQNYPWLKYRCSSPSRSVRREVRIKYLPSDKITFDWLYSYRFSMADNEASNQIPVMKKMETRSLKFAFRYSVSGNLALGTRIDYKIFEPSGSRGVLLMEDLNCKMRKFPLTLWLRYCVFNTADYDSRIYTWENDLLYTFTIPALAGKGSRFYIMAGWKIKDRAEIRFKYGILTNGTSTGNYTDNGEYRLQIKLFI